MSPRPATPCRLASILVLMLGCLCRAPGVDGVLTATVSAASSPGGAALAVDGSTATQWVPASDVSNGSGAWLTLDLGAVRPVNALGVTPVAFGRQFRLESSSDNATWTTVVDSFQAGLTKGAVPSPVNSGKSTVFRMFSPIQARYLRLTSLSVMPGDACALWEVTAANDSAYGGLVARIASVGAQVAALPAGSPDQRMSKAVLTWAVEDAGRDLESGRESAASTTLDEVSARLAANPVVSLPATANPAYFPAFPNGAANVLASNALADAASARAVTTTYPRDTDLADPRGVADRAKLLISAIGHPQAGALTHDPTALLVALRAVQAIADQAGDSDLDQLDFFAKSSYGVASLLLRSRYPGLVPPSKLAAWDAVFHGLGTIEANRTRTSTKVGNVNQEALKWLAMTCAGLAFNDSDLLAVAQTRLAQFEAVMFPDGAFPYSDLGGEANEYQGVMLSQMFLYGLFRNEPRANALIRSSWWYYPLMCRRGPMAEWNTSHIAKDRWNGVSGNDGAYLVAALTGSADNYRIALSGGLTFGDLFTASVHRTDLVTASEPDNWVTFDRNIRGGRGRSGDFSFWTNGNVSNQTNSLAGCMVLNPGSGTGFTLNAAVAGAGSFVRRAHGATVTASEHEANLSWYGERGGTLDTVTTSRFASIAGQHGISQGLFQPTEANWREREQWLATPQGLIGLVVNETTATTQGYGSGGIVKLFSARTAGTRKLWQATAANAWDYGLLSTTVHASTYADATTDYSWCQSWDGTTGNLGAGRLLLRDSAAIAADAYAVNGGTAPAITTYPAGTRNHYLVEIVPNGTAPALSATPQLDQPGGLLGFEARRSDGGRYRLVHNPTTQYVQFSASLSWNGGIWLHRSGETARAPWLAAYDSSGAVDPRGPLPSTHQPAVLIRNGAVEALIPPGAHLVLERDLTLPTAPTALAAVAAAGGVTLSWSSSATNELGFTVQRQVGGSWTTIATTGPGVDQYVDAAGVAGSAYQVLAFTAGGSSAAAAATATAGSVPAVTPSAPVGLSATAISDTRIDLAWSDGAQETGYRIERRTAGGTFAVLGTTAAGVSTWTDGGCTALTTYGYRVTALAGGNASAPSSEATASTWSNVVRNRTVTASGTTPQAAVDGSTGSGWTSSGGGTQTIVLSCGGPFQDVSVLRLTWGAAYASTYSVDGSVDGSTYSTLYAMVNGAGGVDTIPLRPTQRVRFLRLTLSAGPAATYQLNEVEAFGVPSTVTTVAWGGSVRNDLAVALDNAASWSNATVPNGSLASWTAASATAAAIGSGLAPSGVVISDAPGDVSISPGSGSLTLGSSGIDSSTSTRALTISAPLVLAADQTWTTGSGSGPSQITVSGALSGSAALTIAGSRPVALNGTTSTTGGLTVASGALISGAAGLGGNGVTLGANSGSATAALILSAGNGTAWNNPITLGGTSGALILASTVGNSGSVLNGLISGSHDLTIGQTGAAGVVALSANSVNFSGNFIIYGGTLKLLNGSAFSPGTALAVAGGAAVDLNGGGSSWTFNGLSDLGGSGGVIDNAGGPRTLRLTGGGRFTGTITRNIALILAGGTLRLEGASTFTGNPLTNPPSAVTVSAATLEVTAMADGGQPSPLGQSTGVVGNLRLDGGTLRFVGTTGCRSDRLFQVGQATSGGTATLVADGSSGAAVVLTNPGALGYGTTKQPRTLVLDGSNSDGNTLGAALADNGSGGPLTLTKNGTGRWILAGTASHSGTTTIAGGTLELGGSGALSASSAMVIASGAVLDLHGHGATVAALSNGGWLINRSATAATLTVRAPAQTISVDPLVITWVGGEDLDLPWSGTAHPFAVTVTPAVLVPALTIAITYTPWSGDPRQVGTVALGAGSTTPPVDGGWYRVAAVISGVFSQTVTTTLHIQPQPAPPVTPPPTTTPTPAPSDPGTIGAGPTPAPPATGGGGAGGGGGGGCGLGASLSLLVIVLGWRRRR